MTDSNPNYPPPRSSDTPADVNLPWYWALWRRNQTWRENLAKRAAHKALDIPEDDMYIHSGMGWKEMAVVAAMVIAAAIAGGLYVSNSRQQTQSAPPVFTAPGPADSEYEVRFYDADGNLIQVPHISQRPQGESQ